MLFNGVPDNNGNYDEISKPLHFLKQFGLSIEDSVFWTIKYFFKRTQLVSRGMFGRMSARERTPA